MLRFYSDGMKFARYTRVPRTRYSHSSHPKDITCWVDRTWRLMVVRVLYVEIYGRFKENIAISCSNVVLSLKTGSKSRSNDDLIDED